MGVYFLFIFILFSLKMQVNEAFQEDKTPRASSKLTANLSETEEFPPIKNESLENIFSDEFEVKDVGIKNSMGRK